MGGLTVGLIAGGALLGSIALDVTINAMQDWYQTFYADAFWSHRVTDTPGLRDLSREEARINEMLRASSEFSQRQVVLSGGRVSDLTRP